MGEKTVIIGGVAGGATTAARLRRRSESMEIVVLEKGDYISYANCGLPYYIGDVIKSRDALLLQTPRTMRDKFNIDVRIGSEVTAIDRAGKKVTVRELKTGESYEETYDHLVLAAGSSPVKPPIPGIDGENIYTLWNIPDTDGIKAFLEEKKPRRAAVVGGGFIGLEMAENLRRAGLGVSIIEMQEQVMAPLDYEMACLLHENLRDNGVELVLSDGVSSFERQGGDTAILLNSGRIVKAELVILSIGVRPNSELARSAGLTLNARGGVVTDETLRTSDPDIYAVGDVIEVERAALEGRTMIPLAGPANKQARICADNISGDAKSYRGTLGTSVAKVFDLQAAAVGVNEKTLKADGKVKGKDYETALIHQKSHAGYYPGAAPLYLKLVFGLDGRIFGAQAVGPEGADKRIDTLAAVMRMGGRVPDLTELELAYAPPFSSAKDPVNMLGFTAENVLDGLVSFLSAGELDALLEEPGRRDSYMLLDVTEDVERMVYAIPGSYHIPLGQLRGRLGELDASRLIIPYCAVGVRSYNAARILMQNGFDKVKVLAGGTSFYKSMHSYDKESVCPVMETPEALQEDQTVRQLRILDCCGLQCPGPIMKVHQAVQEMQDRELLQVSATDMGFARDIDAWCRRTGNTLVKTERRDGNQVVTIQRGMSGGRRQETGTAGDGRKQPATQKQGKTIIVFDGDLDKALASFIIANGAAAMGRPVTMFFTFWGLNILRRPEKVKGKKSLVEKMFGFMMPRGSGRLKLSKMNMGGMGSHMMKRVMRAKNVDSLETLMQSALHNGVKLVACTMSMDIMGISKEELIDGVQLGGVASYLGDAEEADVNLFI